ncbi:hypothetical protein NBRC10513v2_006292 [Rhodotorula toruloides]
MVFDSPSRGEEPFEKRQEFLLSFFPPADPSTFSSASAAAVNPTADETAASEVVEREGDGIVREEAHLGDPDIFFFGYDQGMMGGVNGAPDYIQTMNLGYLTPSANGGKVGATVTDSTKQMRAGGIVAAYYLGTLIGCLVGGWIGDKLGRKKTIWIGALWILVGAPLQAAAQNVAWMVMARIITGVGTGHLNVIVPVWSAETSGHLSRGFFIALEFTLNIFGVVVAYWLEYGLSFVGDGNTQIRWRFPIAFQPV